MNCSSVHLCSDIICEEELESSWSCQGEEASAQNIWIVHLQSMKTYHPEEYLTIYLILYQTFLELQQQSPVCGYV